MKKRAEQAGLRTQVNRRISLEELRDHAADCRACPLWKLGTQTVFGAGNSNARIMMVGEQPGDYEDRAGVPFVGPAGKLLDRAFAEAGIARDSVYLTNVVKHFKWEPRGKRRLHSKPNAAEVRACRPWIESEIVAVRPEVIVCLGATAAQALIGRQFKVTIDRGKPLESVWARHILGTVHPSSLLREPDDAARHLQIDRFIADLRQAATLVSPATRRRESARAFGQR